MAYFILLKGDGNDGEPDAPRKLELQIEVVIEQAVKLKSREMKDIG